VGTDAVETIPSIRTRRLELVSMSITFMHALVARDLATAHDEVDAHIPADLPDELSDFLQYRLGQLAVDPTIREWLGRLMVLTEPGGSRRVIGTIGFHGPPDDLGRVEIGYRVQPEYRRQGYARECVEAMFEWAHREHGIQRFIASVSPDNAASLGLVRGFGFEQTGSHMDPIDGLELVLEAEWPPRVALNHGAVGAG
jgi:[ribosomal protein S5]-alanine N-acetyltransferase